MKMEYLIRKSGAIVGHLTITEDTEKKRNTLYHGSISLRSGEDLVPRFLRNGQSVNDVKDMFNDEHGGAGYILGDLGAYSES